jgi:hypothetical protein
VRLYVQADIGEIALLVGLIDPDVVGIGEPIEREVESVRLNRARG